MAQKDDNTVPETAGGNSSPFTAWWFIAAGFVVLVIVGLIVALFLPQQSRETAPATGRPRAHPSPAGPANPPATRATCR